MLPSVNVLRNDQKLIPISNHKQKKRKNVLGVSVKISKLKKKISTRVTTLKIFILPEECPQNNKQ